MIRFFSISKKFSVAVALLFFAIAFNGKVYAAAPGRTLGFQGQLFDNATPFTGSVSASFTFYDASSGGNSSGSAILKTITVNNGYFGTQFSEADLSGVDFNQTLYVQVSINGTNLSPRTAVNSAPSAIKAFGAFAYSSAPTVGPAGSMYFNSTDGKLYVSSGSAWGANSPWVSSGSDVSFTGGNVGIGTTTPPHKLYVTGQTTAEQGLITIEHMAQAVGQRPLFQFRKARYSSGAIAEVVDADNLGETVFNAYINGAYRGATSIGSRVNGTVSSTSYPGSLFFATVGTGTTTRTDRMVILADGNVGIGSSTPSAKLTVTGDIRIDDTISRGLKMIRSGVPIGDITTANSRFTLQERSGAGIEFLSSSSVSMMMITGNGNVGIGTTTPTATLHASGTIRFSSLGAGTLTTDSSGNVTVSSDERLKDVKSDFLLGLEAIKGISPITYSWKPETGYDTTNTYAGFSAQNIQHSIPEAVGMDARGFLTLNDRPILAALVNAVKELAEKLSEMAQIVKTNTVKTKNLCVEKANGQEICLTGDQVETLMTNQNITVIQPPVALPVQTPSENSSSSTPAQAQDVLSETALSSVPTPAPEAPVQSVPETVPGNLTQ